MKNRNILAALAAVGLAAAVATPAMALENEFHGMFSARYINSNFNRTPTTDYGPGDGTYDPSGKTKNQYSSNFVEQRARLQYIAKANADLKLVTHFELDYSYWGDSSFGFQSGTGTRTTRNNGAALGADQVNFETKSIYLDANVTKSLNMKLGMQPYNDSFKGIVFDADMAGILFSSSYGKFSPSIGFFRFADTSSNILGHKTSDLFVLDAKYAISKDLKVGAAYYLFKDNSSFTGTTPNVKMNLLGVNAEFTTGPLTLNGFAIYETGTANAHYTNAFAGNLGAKLKVGPGTARTEFLYISGDNTPNSSHGTAFYGVNGQSNGEHGYYDNEMAILGRDKNAYTTDNSIIYNSNNKDQGTIGGYIGYDLPINAKLSTAFNAGFAAVAKDNANKPINRTTSAKNESNYLGTEVNAEATYQLMDSLSLSTRVAYAFLGDYYKGTAVNSNGTPATPVNPYDFKVIFKYTF